MKNLKITYFLMALLAFGIFSCSSDEEPGPDNQNADPVDIKDPNAVGEALTFENGEATVVEEATFPAPSTDAGAPSLDEEDSEDLLAISGGKLALDVDADNVKGAYVKIDGADHYYNIVFDDTNSNGRTARVQSVESILLTLPAGLEAGEFCLTYAVYDDQNRVSNSINVCVEVKSSGGENSSFLTANAWAVISEGYYQIYDGQANGDTTIVGKLYQESYTTSISCTDSTYESFEVVFQKEVKYSYVTFSPDGTFTWDESESHKDIDEEQSTCETGVVYKEGTEIDKESGNWAYDDNTKELTLLFTYGEYVEDGVKDTQTYADTEVYQASYENGKLTLVDEDEEDWGSETEFVILQPK